MFLNVSIKCIIRICFYLILLVVCIKSWIKLLKEPTAFEENIVYNKAKLPSFTLCPTQTDHPISNKSIESFEDIKKVINHVKYKYKIDYLEYKPYEQDKRDETFYNDTSYGAWYFVPQISVLAPFETVICLIWTPSMEHKIKPDWTIAVSYFSFKVISNDTQFQLQNSKLQDLVSVVGTVIQANNVHISFLDNCNCGFVTISISSFAISSRS